MDTFEQEAREIIQEYCKDQGDFLEALEYMQEIIPGHKNDEGEYDNETAIEIISALAALFHAAVQKGDLTEGYEGEIQDEIVKAADGFIGNEKYVRDILDYMYEENFEPEDGPYKIPEAPKLATSDGRSFGSAGGSSRFTLKFEP